MAKIIKWVTAVVMMLIIYGLGAGMTYAAHDAKYPGPEICCNGNGSSVIATFWPIAAPFWLAYEFGVLFVEEAGG